MNPLFEKIGIGVLAVMIFTGGTYFGEWKVNRADKPPTIKETVHHDVKTEIVYVPKEVLVHDQQIIHVKDGVQTVETVKAGTAEKTDIELNAQKATVDVKVNGKTYAFDKSDGETQIFQNDKLVMNQTSTIGVDIKIPDLSQKSLGVGVYGGATSVNTAIVGRVGAFVDYKDLRIGAGVNSTGGLDAEMAWKIFSF